MDALLINEDSGLGEDSLTSFENGVNEPDEPEIEICVYNNCEPDACFVSPSTSNSGKYKGNF